MDTSSVQLPKKYKYLLDHPELLKAESCRRSFAFFVREFWDQIETEPLIWNWHMDIFCFELEWVARLVFKRLPKQYDLLVNVPPGTTKSRIFTVMFPVWCWTIDSTLKFINGSYSSDLSLEHSDLSRDLIKSQKFRLYFPQISIRSDKDSKGSYHSNNRGSRYSTSVGGTVTGMHAHIIIIDDPLNPKKAASSVELKTANHWIEQTLSTRKVNKELTPTIMVMQRLAEEDPSGKLIEKMKLGRKNVRYICLPGELLSPGTSKLVNPPCLQLYYSYGLLDTKRLTTSALDELKTDLGQYGYAGQILQDPTPAEGGMFKIECIEIVDSIPPNVIIEQVRYWDKAGTDKGDNPGSAHTAGVKIGRLSNGYYWSWVIMDVVRGQWEAIEREAHMKQTAQLDGHNVTIWLEQEPGSGGKDSALGTVINLAGYAVHVDRPTGDKVTRADPFSVQVNWKRVCMLRGDWNKDFLEEMRLFPFGKWKDQVDAAAAAFNKMAVSNKRAGTWGRRQREGGVKKGG